VIGLGLNSRAGLCTKCIDTSMSIDGTKCTIDQCYEWQFVENDGVVKGRCNICNDFYGITDDGHCDVCTTTDSNCLHCDLTGDKGAVTDIECKIC